MTLLLADFLGGYWEERAACKGEPTSLFFPEREPGTWIIDEGPAREMCARCPVTAECLNEALKTFYCPGIWGGTNEAERDVIRRQRAATERVRAAKEMA